MASFAVPEEIYRQFRDDLTEGVERAGFFLADFDADSRTLRLRDWKVVPESGFESRGDFHLVLRDDVRAGIIKWAWDEGASLVEAHSHGAGDAEFSPSDLAGLREWVPHLWWRLRGRPYGAIVIAGDTLDALVWTDNPATPQQVHALQIGAHESIPTTRRTLARQMIGEERRGGR